MNVIDLYQGAYGRTIRLATDEEATLQALKRVFLQLARGRQGPFELGETIFPHVDQRTRMLWWNVNEGRHWLKSQRRIRRHFGGYSLTTGSTTP
jgi:hypothetical protein